MTRAPALGSSRVAPLISSVFLTSVALNQNVRDAVVPYSQGPEHNQLHHYTSQLRLHFQWKPAFKMQLFLFRNTVGCVIVAVFVNGCYYSGNIFSFKPSIEQTRPEFLMATLIWTCILFTSSMTIAHLPSLMTQRFLACPEYKPTILFCITLAVRRIYYEETYQGRDRRAARHDLTRSKTTKSPRKMHSPSRPLPKYHPPSFWREVLIKSPNFFLIALAGGYVHVVSYYRILDRSSAVIMGFAIFGISLKLALQELVRYYITKKRIGSIRTMCILVGVPTVLIDTQTRIVLLGTQTNTILVSGTFGMAIAEICFRVVKAAYVQWTIRRRSKAVDLKLQEISFRSKTKSRTSTSSSPLKLEFKLWKRQVLSYHSAEIMADMYAEYIAIGCSQSIIFWYVGHPFYPALQLESLRGLSGASLGWWRFNQVAMLTFQFIVEILVDYVCVVLEMAQGIEFDRVKNLGTFLGLLFMTITVLNISISSAVYLTWLPVECDNLTPIPPHPVK
ncbi:hypothetical protein PHMEG_00014455 [Phytophthora megakarya]|uniref:Transmembrane protein n=1 Tax=Phytophthora megakarya TaxID=4795 RepID=A0A225W4A2_9STRA|nr:hypothetical protein PHMEG_00014455 [Phytophthora megakarya]